MLRLIVRGPSMAHNEGPVFEYRITRFLRTLQFFTHTLTAQDLGVETIVATKWRFTRREGTGKGSRG